MDDEQKRVIGGNEAAFRKVNESLRGKRLAPADQLFAFRCECGVLGCNKLLELTLPEYEAVRADARHFAIIAGHDIPETEHVVLRHERYWVVEKDDDAAIVALDTDPRG